MLQALLVWALIMTGAVQLWHIYILALLLGLTNCLGRPAGQAFVVELVGRPDLPNAVALNSSLTTLTRIVGPGLGGMIIAASGVGTLFLLNALSFITPIVALALMHTRELHAQAPRDTEASGKPTTWESLREGVEYVRNAPASAWLILVVGCVLLFGSNFNVILPLTATDVLHAGARGFGFLSAASGVGALIAALWLAWSHCRPTIRAVLVCTLAFGLLEVGFALSHIYLLSVALIAGVGGAEIAFATLAVTMLQMSAPDHLRGRVMSVGILFFDGSVPLGYLLMGGLAERYGPAAALLIGALLSLLVAGVGGLRQGLAEKSLAAPAEGR
jgi:MFS family permease